MRSYLKKKRRSSENSKVEAVEAGDKRDRRDSVVLTLRGGGNEVSSESVVPDIQDDEIEGRRRSAFDEERVWNYNNLLKGTDPDNKLIEALEDLEELQDFCAAARVARGLRESSSNASTEEALPDPFRPRSRPAYQPQLSRQLVFRDPISGRKLDRCLSARQVTIKMLRRKHQTKWLKAFQQAIKC